MEINGLGHIDGPQSIRAPHRAESIQPQSQTDSLGGADAVDISPEAELVQQINDIPDIRTELVQRIKSEISAGVYETDAKLEVAVGRLFDEIG